MTTAALAQPDLASHARGSSFHKAMLLLPRGKRKALLALYALCRKLDDAVDDAPDSAAAQANLACWQREMDAVFAGRTPADATAQAFATLHKEYDFRQEDMQAMLDALSLDAQGAMVHPAPARLEVYCHGVAGAVGLMAMRIFGCDQPEARPFAIALGHALQLTNILRDVAVDARMGRIYLPAGTLPAQLGTQARARFAEADALGMALPTRAIAPALAMRDVYALYWQKLEANGWRAPEDGKIPLTKSEKTHLATRASGYLLGRFRAVELS